MVLLTDMLRVRYTDIAIIKLGIFPGEPLDFIASALTFQEQMSIDFFTSVAFTSRLRRVLYKKQDWANTYAIQ